MAHDSPSALRRPCHPVRRHQTLSFVLLTLVFSWAAWLVPLLALGPEIPELLLAPGGFGPAVAAVAVTWLSGDSVRDWLGSLRGDGSRRWLLAALAVPPLLGVAVGTVLVADVGSLSTSRLAQLLPLYPLLVLPPLLVGGGQEEVGWRGFALPRLQSRHSALSASLRLGVVWACWHLPLFVVPGGLYTDQSFALYVPTIVGFSVLFTWLYNGSGGSVPAAMLLHAGVNTAPNLPVPAVGGETALSVPFLAVLGPVTWLFVLGLVVRYGPETLAPGEAVTVEVRPDEAIEDEAATETADESGSPTEPTPSPADGEPGGVEA